MRGKAQYGPVLFGKVWRHLAKFCMARFREVLIGVAGLIGALYSMVRSYCGVVWNREARHVMAKFCPVKHGMAWLGVIVLWGCEALWSAVWSSAVMCAKALLRSGIAMYGIVRSGFARLRAAGQALVRRYFGLAMQGGVLFCTVQQGQVSPHFGMVLRSWVMHGDVWQRKEVRN